MNDFRDLKATAEACQQHQPLRFMRSHGALFIRNDNGIVFDVHQNRSFPEFMAQNKDYADLVLAANPATILALITENERLVAWREGLLKERAAHIRQRDQLKAENEALLKDAERYRRMRSAALKQADVLADEFDAEFDLQLDAALGKEVQS
jgi:hypothetical protein